MKKKMATQATVMIVDDDIDLLENIKDSIEDSFGTVIAVDRATKALEVLKTKSVDCIVTDYMMPEINGLEFIRILEQRTPQIPIILLTGNGSNSEVISAVESGAFDYMDKPFKAPVLINRIRNALLLPKLESLILELARVEFPELDLNSIMSASLDARLSAVAQLEAVLRVRLQAREAKAK